MMHNIEYKGFIADLTFNDYKAAYVARVINCKDTILCAGPSLKAIKKTLTDSIDLYLHLCKQKGMAPTLLKLAN